jgi:hypothetical protein
VKHKRLWLQIGWLTVVSLTACNRAPLSSATQTIPALSPGVPIPATSAPTLLWTVVPISPTQVISEETLAVTPTAPPPSSPAWQDLVRQAKEHLAQQLSIDVSQVVLVEARAVVWPDSSLGCPQPGMAYTQVQRDGLLIVLSAGGRTYEYHSGASRPPFLCKEATKVIEPLPPPDAGDE